MTHVQQNIGSCRQFYKTLHGCGIPAKYNRMPPRHQAVGQTGELRLHVDYFGHLYTPPVVLYHASVPDLLHQ